MQPLAKAVKEKVGDKLAVGTVGAITEGKQANQLLEEGLDVIICGRAFQKNPGLVWKFAEDLGTEIQIANQIRYVARFLEFLAILINAKDGDLAVVQALRRNKEVWPLRLDCVKHD